MKNYALFALIAGILFIGGCSKSESEPTFSPPSWIQGSWVHSVDFLGVPINGRYKFTSDDLYLIFNSLLIEPGLSDFGANLNEISNSNSEYSFSYILENESGEEQFVAVTCVPGSSSDEIECTSDSVTIVYTSTNSY